MSRQPQRMQIVLTGINLKSDSPHQRIIIKTEKRTCSASMQRRAWHGEIQYIHKTRKNTENGCDSSRNKRHFLTTGSRAQKTKTRSMKREQNQTPSYNAIIRWIAALYLPKPSQLAHSESNRVIRRNEFRLLQASAARDSTARARSERCA